MEKSSIYKTEYDKLVKIFKNVKEDKKQLAEGLIRDAAFLFAKNSELIEKMNGTGMIKIHPHNPSLERRTESGKQFLNNVNTYATVIKTLNNILNNNVIKEEDAFEKWMKEKQQKG